MAVVPEDVTTTLAFLKPDPRHEQEKPYRMRYDPGPDIPRTNCETQSQSDITIHDIRHVKGDYMLERNGFEVVELKSRLAAEEFYDEEKVKNVWYLELKEMCKRKYGAKRVEVLEHGIRKRHVQFPISTGDDYEHLQPTSIIHIDFTPESALIMSQQGLRVDPSAYNRVQIFNIWKPLHGPLTDWPLTVCDSRTVTPERDCIATDVVERSGFTENYQVYYHPDMRFCYLSGQRADEVIVFRQTDTEPGCVPHAGFLNPKTTPGERPRESIETRVFLYY
ncbi:hypothetical protein BDV96DRAFT_611800 [Lophiotrema nucula]|uniref:Methyltransferase n=1 Tax=Lophiotrema nucula TaxID=690887 RepID=A0A6A5ZD70_9PLEO|nr:hypothetical protein BDV96DRAFT_611800 [Lophiotrema nucula]